MSNNINLKSYNSLGKHKEALFYDYVRGLFAVNNPQVDVPRNVQIVAMHLGVNCKQSTIDEVRAKVGLSYSTTQRIVTRAVKEMVKHYNSPSFQRALKEGKQ